MPANNNLENIMKQAVRDAEMELKNYPVMPEHYGTMLKHPNLDARGYYSELDFEIGARFKRCDTFSQTKGILDKAMYEHVRGEIETKGAKLKQEVINLSIKHRTLTRAARICDNPEAKEKLKKLADDLKSSKAVKDYNLLITGLEYYAGVHGGKKVMPMECVEALDRCIGYKTNGEIARPNMGTSGRLRTVPPKMKIEFRDMDKFMQQMMISHPSFKEKMEQRKGKGIITPKDKLFDYTVTSYSKDACKDTLDALASNMEERMDLLIINGQTLREMIEDKTKNKNPSKEEIENLSCEYVNAALRSGGSVEVFTPHIISPQNKTYRPDPVVIEGSKPRERVTMKFWEIWLAKIGFFKDKYKQYKMQEKMDACRERVRKNINFAPKTMKEIREATQKGISMRKMVMSLNENEKQEQEARQKIVEKYKDEYVNAVRMKERKDWQREALLYSFYPEGAEHKESVIIDNKFDSSEKIIRDIPLYYAVAKMMQKGYSLKDAIDPTKFRDVRAKIGKEFKEEYENMTPKDIAKLHVDSMKIMAEKMPPFIEEMSQVMKTREDIRENHHKYFLGVVCLNVPRMDHRKRPEAIEYCGGEKEYDALVKQLVQADAFYTLESLYNERNTYFHSALDGGNLKVADTMRLDMCENLVLMGLKGKEPKLAPKMLADDIYILKSNVELHPEVKRCQEQMGPLDTQTLDEKMAENILKKMKIDSLDMKIEAFGKGVKVTKDFHDVPKGYTLGLNLMINKQKLFEMEESILEVEDEIEVNNEIDVDGMNL